MKPKQKTGRTAWRIPPCPGYDVEGMESWLESMAAQGLQLKEDGFFAGIASFKRAEPRKIRYRLEADSRKRGFFAEGGAGPDEEERSFGEAGGWKYIARRGDFFIFAADSPETVELHTDPQVQAIALRLIHKRLRNNLLSLLLWLIGYSLLAGMRMPLAAWINLGTPLYLLFHAVLFWSIGGSAASVLHLRRLRKRLKQGQPLNHQKDWKKHGLWYRVSQGIHAGLLVACAIVLLCRWSEDATGANILELERYTGDIPFATMEDFRPDAAFVLEDMGFGNEIKSRSDPLAPVFLSLSQAGKLESANGERISGGIEVTYIETLFPWMAQELAREYEAYDRRTCGKRYAALPSPDVPQAESVKAYRAIFPTLILTRDNKMIRFQFYQTSEDTLPLSEWAVVVADSLG